MTYSACLTITSQVYLGEVFTQGLPCSESVNSTFHTPSERLPKFTAIPKSISRSSETNLFIHVELKSPLVNSAKSEELEFRVVSLKPSDILIFTATFYVSKLSRTANNNQAVLSSDIPSEPSVKITL